MKIIALLGKNSSGKSCTLNILYTLLLNEGYIQIDGYHRSLGAKTQNDFFDVFQNENKKIGICSMGDYVNGNDSVEGLLKQFSVIGCTVTFCACTTDKIKTVSAIEKYTDHIKIPRSMTKCKKGGV